MYEFNYLNCMTYLGLLPTAVVSENVMIPTTISGIRNAALSEESQTPPPLPPKF